MAPVPQDPKLCRACGERKPRAEFYPHSRAKGGVSTLCRPCHNAAAVKQQCKQPERTRETQRRSKLKCTWGMTPAAFEARLAAQGGGCAICGTKTPGGKGRFAVDHDHKTGEVRGLLCNWCNPALGLFKDNPALLESAIRYLKNGGYRE